MFGGVHIGLSEEDGTLVGGDLQDIAESVFPEQLHVIPVGDHAVGNGVLDFVEASLAAFEILSHVSVELVAGGRDHNIVFRPSDSAIIILSTWMGLCGASSTSR